GLAEHALGKLVKRRIQDVGSLGALLDELLYLDIEHPRLVVQALEQLAQPVIDKARGVAGSGHQLIKLFTEHSRLMVHPRNQFLQAIVENARSIIDAQDALDERAGPVIDKA